MALLEELQALQPKSLSQPVLEVPRPRPSVERASERIEVEMQPSQPLSSDFGHEIRAFCCVSHPFGPFDPLEFSTFSWQRPAKCPGLRPVRSVEEQRQPLALEKAFII